LLLEEENDTIKKTASRFNTTYLNNWNGKWGRYKRERNVDNNCSRESIQILQNFINSLSNL